MASHRSKNLGASWKLGKLAAELLDKAAKNENARLSSRQLAETIGLIPQHDPEIAEKPPDASTLRQLIKFADFASKDQAAELRQLGVPWRAVVYWIGVRNENQRARLYEKMRQGMVNSTEIRDYIDRRFKKPALPRRHVDLSRDYKNAQVATDKLVETLKNLETRLAEKTRDGGELKKRERKGLEASQGRLDAAVKEVTRLARAARAKLRLTP